MKCPLKFNMTVTFDENSLKCDENNCAWWIGGEQQECAIKNLAFHIRMINQNMREK